MWGVKVMLTLALGLVGFMVQDTMQLDLDQPYYNAIQRLNGKAKSTNTPVIGLVLTSKYDEDQLLASGYFVPDSFDPSIQIAGRDYKVGRFMNNMIAIYVLAGDPLAGVSVTVQILLDKFGVGALISTGRATSLVDGLHVGDVAVVHSVTYTSVWTWQAWKGGSESQEKTNISMKFGDFNVPEAGDNKLASIELNPVTRFTPLGSNTKNFWFPISPIVKRITSKLVDIELEKCDKANNCFDEDPKVVNGMKAGSSDAVIFNEAFGEFLHQKHGLSILDRQTAAVASTAYANGVPYAVFRGVINKIGDTESDKSLKMVGLATKNTLKVAATFAHLIAAKLSPSINHYSDA